jgi:hypothetical protein
MNVPNDDDLIAVILEKLRHRDRRMTFEDWDQQAAAHWWRALDPVYNRRIALMRAKPKRGRHRPINAFVAFGGISDAWVDQRILVSMAADDVRWIKKHLPWGRKSLAIGIALKYSKERLPFAGFKETPRPVKRGALQKEMRRNPSYRR